MTKADLKRAFELMTDLDKMVDKFHDLGLDFVETTFYNVPGFLFDMLINSNYTEEGQDIINWFFFEKSSIPESKAYDSDGNEICKDIDELYEYVKQFDKHPEE